MLPSIFLLLHNIWLCSSLMMISLKMLKGARPDGDLAVPPELEAYFSVDAQVALTIYIDYGIFKCNEMDKSVTISSVSLNKLKLPFNPNLAH